MIFQLLWKNGKLNWPNRARTLDDSGVTVINIKYFINVQKLMNTFSDFKNAVLLAYELI